MDQELWTKVDEYFSASLLKPDTALEDTLKHNKESGLPAIDLAPNQGVMLHLFAKIQHAKKVLEIGTLGGYSTICLARALPSGGKLITLELNPKHAEVAADNLLRAGVSEFVNIMVGPALQSLEELASQQDQAPFDLIFIDADKKTIPEYFDWAIKLSRTGTVIIVDNVVRDGTVIDESTQDLDVQGVRSLMDKVRTEGTVTASAIQTVGLKGYDGFMLCVVN